MKTNTKRSKSAPAQPGQLAASQPLAVVIPNPMRLVIDSIPVNPDARIDKDTRKIFLGKLALLRESRKRAGESQRSEDQKRMLEAYRHESGFDEKLAAVRKAQAGLIARLNDLAAIGLDLDGEIAFTYERVYDGSGPNGGGSKMVPRGSRKVTMNETPSSDRAADTERVQGKINVAMDLAEVFSEFDALELRMAMAATYREAATIMNAAAGCNIIAFEPEGKESLALATAAAG